MTTKKKQVKKTAAPKSKTATVLQPTKSPGTKGILIGWGYAQMQRKLTEWAAENPELAGKIKTE